MSRGYIYQNNNISPPPPPGGPCVSPVADPDKFALNQDPDHGSGFQNCGSESGSCLNLTQNRKILGFFVLFVPLKADTRFLLEDHTI